MSTRHPLDMTMGASTLLLLVAVGVVFGSARSQGEEQARVELAGTQQAIVQDLTRQASALAEAEDRAAVAAAREALARTATRFDRNLNTLRHGGAAVDPDGRTVVIGPIRNNTARIALEDGTRLWREIGAPLADLAGGKFSIFGAAGQGAVNGLSLNSGELMQSMRAVADASRIGADARRTIADLARWAAFILSATLVGLAIFRHGVLAAKSKRQASPPHPSAPPADRIGSVPGPTTRSTGDLRFAAPEIDFDSVSASVDQVTVDMSTIAGSTEKMRLAIDSVGHALQGLFDSLNGMARDTAEGHRVVRNANNAASFAAATADDLAGSARDMARVVSRVTQLAQRTKQIAARIDSEAVPTGGTGDPVKSVVAGEVLGLAHQTNRATQEIEQTVAEILATARNYEEAIGQIVKNICAINRVSQNLGELMTAPPPQVEFEAPRSAASRPAPDTDSASQPEAPPAAAPTPAPPTPEADAPTASPATENDAVTAPAPVYDDDPVKPDVSPEELAADTAAAIKDAAGDPGPGPKDRGNGSSVFMLNNPQSTSPGAAKGVTSAPVSDTEPTPAATPPSPVAPHFTGPNVYGLELPEDRTNVQGTAPGKRGKGGDGGSDGNIFRLNRPKK